MRVRPMRPGRTHTNVRILTATRCLWGAPLAVGAVLSLLLVADRLSAKAPSDAGRQLTHSSAVAAPSGMVPIGGFPTIAVLDTGVDAAHPDLAGRVLGGQSFTGGIPSSDPNGHGTAMAGIA